MGKKSSMNMKAASRIQSRADKSLTNQGFKARAMSAAASNNTTASSTASAATAKARKS